METNTTLSRRHAGPSLLLLAIVHTLLFVASLVSLRLLEHTTSVQALNPYAPPETARSFFAANPEAMRLYAFFFFASAVPLAVYAATALSRLRFLGVRAAGTYIAFAGGLATSFAIAAAGLCAWTLSLPEIIASPAVTRVVHFMTFFCGGPAFAAGFGLLAAGVSVTSYFSRLLPRWVIWLGLVVAVAGELSTLTLVATPMTFAIPVTRFGGFIWLIAVGAMLPKRVVERDV